MTRDDCDDFTRGYLDCAAWLANDARGNPIEWGAGPADDAVAAVKWTRQAVATAVEECRQFQADNAADLEAFATAGFSASRAGHNFFLTRNRHGTGFWDEGVGAVGGRLTDAAHAWGEATAVRYRGKFQFE